VGLADAIQRHAQGQTDLMVGAIPCDTWILLFDAGAIDDIRGNHQLLESWHVLVHQLDDVGQIVT